MERYEHKQQSTWMYWIGIAILALFMLLTRTDPSVGLPLALSSIFIAAVLVVFSRLTTAVDDRAVSWAFGWGWPGGSIALHDIASVEITETTLLEGWGIHWTIWHGWLWNAGGFAAVEIWKLDGSRVTLGTDNPAGLYDAIVAHRKSIS